MAEQQIATVRDKRMSLWQSAVDAVVARSEGAPASTVIGADLEAAPAEATARPGLEHPMIAGASVHAQQVEQGVAQASPEVSTQPGTVVAAETGPAGVVKSCSEWALRLAEAKITRNQADVTKYGELLGAFGTCDPRWIQAVEEYVKFFQLDKGTIPYRVWQQLGDFVIDGALPAKARVAIIGDWGTGLPAALGLLRQVARKQPQIVVHLGDIYYSGTADECRKNFLAPYRSILPAGTRLFTLTGNHDMYSGGVPYYQLLDEIGQPASYFCLRNAEWQLLAMDTGLHDHDPFGVTNAETFLEATEVAWLEDKVANAAGRKTILLSHHQLFSAYEAIDKGPVNQTLRGQLAPKVLPGATAWFWGHEHNLTIFQRFAGTLGRCIGCAAVPVAVSSLDLDRPEFPDVPREPVRLGNDGVLYNLAYAIVDLDGPNATVTYWQDSDEKTPLWTETL